MAIKSAKEKALYLAEELGQTIGAALNIEEVRDKGYSYGRSSVASNYAGTVSSSYSSNISELSLGQIIIFTEIKATFELK